jgi:hypothetical protein
MACGYDPEGLRPAEWQPAVSASGSSSAPTSGATATLVAPSPSATSATTAITDVRPQRISDPDWVQQPSRRRLSLLATAGVVAAILVAVAGLVFVILMVLNQPVGTTQADALGLSGPAAASAR